VSIKNCCNRPIIKNCYLEKGIAFNYINLEDSDDDNPDDDMFDDEYKESEV
jgi:hypothetical protein